MPESTYMAHVTPNSGTAVNILKSTLKYFDDSDVSTDVLRVVGYDRTNVIIFKFNGVIVQLEKHLNRPLQWLICQLHCNELPLRHLMNFLDSSTTGPRHFNGPIGQALIGCKKLPVVKFSVIESYVQENVDRSDLSTDQQYLLDMCVAISEGSIDNKLSKRCPCKIVHSRWLPLANRILRLYVSTVVPSDNLITLATFILKVYAPVWFLIKTRPSCLHGVFNFWKMIQLPSYLPQPLKDVMDPVLLRNSFFAHPENMLLGMLGDPRKHIRELAVRRIFIARKSNINQRLRTFEVPPVLNMNAMDYIINWSTIPLTEPPLTIGSSNETLQEIVVNPETSALLSELKFYPSHNQAVEGMIKLVTEASAKVRGADTRDGLIRTKLELHRIMPYFRSKKDYNL
ncbi:unnamed protein product [Diabrotica balteata]|uniref:Uncharacterized protein n=1 Tax=Diabrotica balteata TaxID=107213 RepID=A0A9N9XIH5_DIABA|nr:unnamed protein product [Diabrotica balteata]